MRFLIVEDHIGMADQLAKGFSARGYSAKLVDNGEEGLFEAQEIDYTLAVIDLGLPGMSGLELIKKLRKSGNQLPIIVLTARNDVETIVQAMEAGADDYLKKPVYFEELFAHVEAVLRRVLG
ncbi:MAG: response regulator transcription factor, partial [Pseudomonadota bacterium]